MGSYLLNLLDISFMPTERLIGFVPSIKPGMQLFRFSSSLKQERKGPKMKNRKVLSKGFALLLALVLVAGFVPITARAEHGSLYYNNTGENYHNYKNGYLTPDTALEISTPQDLLDFAALVNENKTFYNIGDETPKYVKLTKDINMSSVCGPNIGNWTPIGCHVPGYGEIFFRGVFDGCGHTVSGLYYNGASGMVGLFGGIMSQGVNDVMVKNVKLENANLTGYYSVGGICGQTEGPGFRIENCSVSGVISGNNNVGGIVGGANASGTIESCCVSADISASGDYVGGISGYMGSSVSVRKCYATVTVTCGGSCAGGIAGNLTSSGTLNACIALQSAITAASNAGRIAGALSGAGGTVSSCYAWENMTVGGVPVDSADTGSVTLNGANLTADAALTGSTYLNAGWSAGVWTLENGKLPYITGFGEVDPLLYAYLTDASGGDDTAPTLSGVSFTDAGATYATIRFTSDEAGDYYCLTLPAAAPITDTDTIKATGVTGVAQAAVNSFSVGGLTASTGYVAYLFVEDISGNTSTVASIPFTTEETDDTDVPPYINSVYQIGSAAQLCWFRDLVNGALTDGTPRNTSANAVLTADIDLSSVCGADSASWTPVGISSGSYTGTFDGASFTISYLYIDTTADNQALFGAVGAGTVKDLTVQGSVRSTGGNVAGIAASASGSSFIGCRNEAAINGRSRIGGIAGSNAGDAWFEACINSGSVSGTSYVGGIAGYAPSGAFDYCVNTGAVTGQDENAGGIAGSGKMFNGCKNSGIVSGTAIYAGGIAGSAGQASVLTGCENTASVTGTGKVGGVVGYLSGGFDITNCANSGSVTISYAGLADSGIGGGLFGLAQVPVGGAASSVTNSYNTGGVTDLSGPDIYGGSGGLGGAVSCSSNTITIKNCYSSGNISGVNNIGGLLGSVTAASSGSVAVTNCYGAATAVTDTSGVDATLGGAVGHALLSGVASPDAIVFSNLFYMDSGVQKGTGDNSANINFCATGVRSAAAMKTQSFLTQLGGAFTFYADGIAEITGEPPAGTEARFAAYEYPILRSWLELADNTTYNVQFLGAQYTDVMINGAATYATAVAPGQSITFTVESKYPEVTLDSVSAGGSMLTPDGDGLYTISDITADTVVNVATSGQPDAGGEDIYDITFTTTPADALVTVTGGEGEVASVGGVYELKAGSYSYTVSASGYVTKSGTFSVTGDRNIVIELTQEGAACTVILDSSMAASILSGGLVVGTIPGDKSATAIELGAGTYTYETSDWGGGSFTVEGDMSLSLRKVDFSEQLRNTNNVLYTMSITDSNGVVYTPGGTSLASGDARARFLLPVQKGKIAYNYTFNVPSNYWASGGETYVYNDTDFAALNLSDSGKFVISPKIALSITVPEGSDLIVFQRPKFYRPYCLLNGTSVGNGDGTETYMFEAPADTMLCYVLKLDGYVKKSYIFDTGTGDKSRTIPLSSLAPLSAWSGDVKDASQDFYEANLLVNIADSKYLSLEEGGQYELYLFRAWQPLDSITSNNYVNPDYHFDVIYGDSVEVVDTYYAGATIKAVPGRTGLSVVKITYDALDHCGQVYSKLWTENTGIVVVNVGAASSGTTINPGITLTDNDTAYYIRSINGVSIDAYKQYAEYTFTPSAESAGQSAAVTSVRVHQPLGDTDWTQSSWNDDAFWTEYTANSDDSYTVHLTDGRNVIEICAGDAVTYYTVSAYGTDVTISGAEVTKALYGRLFVQVEAGNDIEISFDELRMPIAKLGAISNPGFPDKTYLVYTLDDGTANGIESEHTQYAIRLNNTITLTAFSVTGQHSLTDGKVHTTAITSGGFTYRDITKGSSSNSEYMPGQDSSENINGFFSVLPDIEFTVVEAKTDAEKVAELIDAIGTVTKYSAGALNAARDAYNALSAEEKAQVTNYNVLLAAEEEFERILAESGPTPVFIWNITGETATYKVGDTASVLQVAVSVAEQGTLTYQWYVRTQESGVFTPISGAVSSSYTPSTEDEGTSYYKVIVTNHYEGNNYMAESGVACVVVNAEASGKDITHTTSYYPTTGLSFNMDGQSIAGYVTISFVDYGVRTSDKVDMATPLGVLVLPTQVPYALGDTIATVTLRLLDALNVEYSHWGTVLSGFYLECIKDFYVSDGTLIDILGEFDAGGGSGWMITWNNWFINMGASEFQVEDGDIIKWQFTCQLGSDIGCSMSDPSAEITGISFASAYGELSPAFNTGTESYTYTIPSTVTSVSLEALQANYWAQLTCVSGGIYYKPLQAIPVANGTVITLECNYYNDYMNKAASLVDSDKVTITINVSNEDNAIITPSVTAVDGTASVTIEYSQFEEAIIKVKLTGGDIIITPQITGTLNTVTVELPKTCISRASSQTEANLVIRTPVGSMTIPNGALAAIASWDSDSTVTVSIGTFDVKRLTAAQQEAVGDGVVYDISIMIGDQNITSYGGSSLTLSLPYTPKDGEDPSDIKVWYLDEDGELTVMNCYYNEKTGTVCFTTDHLSYYVVGCSETDTWDNPFTDVSATDWFNEAVKYAVTNRLMNGTSDTTFSPNQNMTRAMLVTVLYRLAGEPDVTADNAFDDVEDGQWYTDAVLWASENEIVSGYGGGLFGTNDSVTREQMAAILYNYAAYKGYDVTAAADLVAFADAGDISDWASRAMRWASAEGLINGVTETSLAPSGSATRAQVATILMRFCENIVE